MRGTDSGPARLEDASNSQEQRTDRVPCLHFTQGTEDYARIERTPGFQSVILRKQRGTAVCRPSKNFLSHRPFTGGSFFSCMIKRFFHSQITASGLTAGRIQRSMLYVQRKFSASPMPLFVGMENEAKQDTCFHVSCSDEYLS